MRMLKKISIILFVFLLAFSVQTEVFAHTQFDCLSAITENETTIYFYQEVSPETKQKIINHFTNTESNTVSTRGITCTLLGHDLETGSVDYTTHKARTTAPRCLVESYDYEVCSRCDYSEYTLIGSTYIYCCE